ncbi:sugar transferase [Lactococcus nasutitermitis]|uniref:Sugar transferase n=1 Tax=Lactococcus nasutitermitis TaxID=1652957 RepID=A0ABV9JCD1_9LACT|nr:sugar transferase [Lactococcus nasutitermitis]
MKENEKAKRTLFRDDYTESLIAEGLVKIKRWTVTEIIIKRLIDILGGLMGSLLFLLIMIILFPFYKLSPKKDKGPMIFKQKRYGKHGEIFYILKFRTMIVNAEEYFETHPDVYEEYQAHGNKLKNDPRFTKIGSIIRNHSIDEFPQFFNVLKGDMSLVGPRPILLFEEQEYGSKLPYLLICKPGITGYWTTHGRSKVYFPERCDLELKYLNVHSLGFDFLTIFRTVAQAINGADMYEGDEETE